MTGHPWTRTEKWYLAAVVVMGYALLPAYMVNTGVYGNWPAVFPEGIFRLFLGTNVLGIWDELFFICTVFVLLRRHLPPCAGKRAAGRPVHLVPVGTGVPRLGAGVHFPLRAAPGVHFHADKVTVLHREPSTCSSTSSCSWSCFTPTTATGSTSSSIGRRRGTTSDPASRAAIALCRRLGSGILSRSFAATTAAPPARARPAQQEVYVAVPG